MKAVFPVVIAALFTLCTSTRAIDGLMFNIGNGIDDSLIQYNSSRDMKQYAAGVFWNTDFTFKHGLLGYADLTFEAYAAHLAGDKSLNLVAARPVLTFWESEEKQRSWFWQIGLGAAYLSDKELTESTLSTRAQFITLLGLGIPLDAQRKQHLILRYNHYSNGYLKRPNPGLDTISLDWTFNL